MARQVAAGSPSVFTTVAQVSDNTNENITQITIENAPSDCSEFTIKFTQDASTTYTVDFDDIRDNDGAALGIHWPGGGLLPIMTPTASRSDIYGYKTFDSGSNWYGFVVGQNFL